MIKERITDGDKQHLRRLLSLHNNYLLPIYRIDNLDSHSPVVDIVSVIFHFEESKTRKHQQTNLLPYFSYKCQQSILRSSVIVV